MKSKPLLILFLALPFSVFCQAKKKAATDTSSKKSTVTKARAQYEKAVADQAVDSVKSKTPKVDYGFYLLKSTQVKLYGGDNKPRYNTNNPDTPKTGQPLPQKVDENTMYAFTSIDSVQIVILKNVVYRIRVFVKGGDPINFDGPKEVGKIPDTYVIETTYNNACAKFKVADFLIYEPGDPIDDNIQSNKFTLVKKGDKASLTGYSK